jgi:GH15 family glucan-1,4-alpha-glucosidase
MGQASTAASPLGLLAEHDDPQRTKPLGNFPQSYSHLGQINAAFAVSEPWDDVL